MKIAKAGEQLGRSNGLPFGGKTAKRFYKRRAARAMRRNGKRLLDAAPTRPVYCGWYW